jgi:hypothetical protein
MQVSTYSLGPVTTFPENFTGSAIVLLKIENIPPHLGLLHNGLYYSLSVKGVKANIPFEQFSREVQQAKISCVLVEIEPPFYIESPLRYFENYGKLSSAKEVTCLYPIRDWLGFALDDETGSEIQAAGFVFELIEALGRDGRTGKVYGLHVNDTELILPTYTQQDILNEIKRKGGQYA